MDSPFNNDENVFPKPSENDLSLVTAAVAVDGGVVVLDVDGPAAVSIGFPEDGNRLPNPNSLLPSIASSVGSLISSSACAFATLLPGCGWTPAVKLASHVWLERDVIHPSDVA